MCLCVFIGWKIFSVRKYTWCVTVSVWERWLLSSHTITGKKRHRCVEVHTHTYWKFPNILSLGILGYCAILNRTFTITHTSSHNEMLTLTLASTCMHSHTHKYSIRIITIKHSHSKSHAHNHSHNQTLIIISCTQSHKYSHNQTFTIKHSHTCTFTSILS